VEDFSRSSSHRPLKRISHDSAFIGLLDAACVRAHHWP
jgi:hypothetical protein